MMQVSLTIPGAPFGKQVAKVYPVKNGRGQIIGHRGVTQPETKNHLAYIRLAFQRAFPGFTPIEGPVRLSIGAYFPIKKSARKCDLPALMAEEVFCDVKPDLSNIFKLAEDALEGVAYVNDSRIASYGPSQKVYSPRPRLELTIQKLQPQAGADK